MEWILKIVAFLALVYCLVNVARLVCSFCGDEKRGAQEIPDQVSTRVGTFILSSRDDEDWILRRPDAPCRISIMGELEPDPELLEFVDHIVEAYPDIERHARDFIGAKGLVNPLLVLLYVKGGNCFFDLRVGIGPEERCLQFQFQPGAGVRLLP